MKKLIMPTKKKTYTWGVGGAYNVREVKVTPGAVRERYRVRSGSVHL